MYLQFIMLHRTEHSDGGDDTSQCVAKAQMMHSDWPQVHLGSMPSAHSLSQLTVIWSASIATDFDLSLRPVWLG